MSLLLKILPLAAAAGVVAVNGDALKKSLSVIGKVQVAATGGIEMQGLAEAVAMDFVETKNLPIENFGAFLKENLRERGGKETRDKSKDPWGTEYRLNVDPAKNGFSVKSAGPDKGWKTEDDLAYFYSLTGLEGKNAISAELAARARAQNAREGSSSTASSSTGRSGNIGSPPPGSTKKSTAPKTPPKPSQSKEETAFKLVEIQTKRAESGDPQAAFDLATRYIVEDGVAKDYELARKLMEQAVKNADTQTLRERAQTQLDSLNRVLNK